MSPRGSQRPGFNNQELFFKKSFGLETRGSKERVPSPVNVLPTLMTSSYRLTMTIRRLNCYFTLMIIYEVPGIVFHSQMKRPRFREVR